MAPTKRLELVWHKFECEIAALLKEGNYPRGISKLEGFLSRESNSELRARALGLLAYFEEDLNLLERAKKHLLQAHFLARPAFSRYVYELSLARMSERLGHRDEAASWYRRALRTCGEAKAISGGAALRRFLAVRGQRNLTQRERALCIRVARKSWQFLTLPGEPDVKHLTKTALRIIAAEARPPRSFRLGTTRQGA